MKSKSINIWAVSLLKYSAEFVNWKRSELQEIDRKTRKYLRWYGGLHPKASIYRLYLPRKEGGQGLIAAEDFVCLVKTRLEFYASNRDERLTQAARGE